MKSFKEYLQEAPPINRLPTPMVNQRVGYLSNVMKGKPVGRRDKSFGRIPRRSRFAKLPSKIRAILGTNI
jgi:hypothetical protein